MSSCLSGGGGRTYGLDLEFVKSPCSSTRTTSHTSSPSSTISEAGNSPLAISTRKSRTPRKRPNQTYNEAAALLSTAYPNLFSTKNLKTPTASASASASKSNKLTKPMEALEVLLPFRALDSSKGSGLLLQQDKPGWPKLVNLQDKEKRWQGQCQSPGEISSAMTMMNSLELEDDCGPDFDAESIILDEEIEEGIDSIMGSRAHDDSNANANANAASSQNPWNGFTGKLDFRRAGVRALRHVDHGANWWNFPAVDILQISPKIGNNPPPPPADKKKKKKPTELPKPNPNPIPIPNPNPNPGLLLKLNYDEVRNAWSDRGSPFANDSDVPPNDVTARLSQIDLLWDNGGVREASVLRYKEKRRTRLFSKKIRYQVRKVNADRRPRMKVRPS